MQHEFEPVTVDGVLQSFQVPGFNVRLVSLSDAATIRGAAQIIADVFRIDEPLTLALTSNPENVENGVVEQLEEFWNVLCQNSVEQQLLMVAETPGGRIAAVAAGITYGTKLTLPSQHGQHGVQGPITPFCDILARLDPAIQAMIQQTTAATSRPAKVLEVYANATLPEYRMHRLPLVMDAALSALALFRGFTHVTAKLTNPWQAAFKAYGVPMLQCIDYKTYELDGACPFASISAPQGVTSIWCELAFFQLLVRSASSGAFARAKRTSKL